MVDLGLISGFLQLVIGFHWKGWFWCIPTPDFCGQHPCRFFVCFYVTFAKTLDFFMFFQWFFRCHTCLLSLPALCAAWTGCWRCGEGSLFADSEIGRNFYGWSGVDFRIFVIFHRLSLKMGVLVHPHSGLLWPASLPGFFVCFVIVIFEKKHDLCCFSDDFSWQWT